MGKDWYDENIFLNLLWLISGVVYVPIFLVAYIICKTKGIELPKWIKWWGNRVDNFTDQIMEWIHCHKIPYSEKIWPKKWPQGLQFNISCIMKNRETTWDIIRPHGCWPNCDPEDEICN